jgi:tryptophanyl-tRNA synthetase
MDKLDAPPVYGGPTRIVSGVQASGTLHLGNYLGALQQLVALQNTAPTFVFVADLHAITIWQNPATLASQTREIAATYLAVGLDPQKAAIFPQSAVRAHAELGWILNCVARIGWLNRMTQFKEKSKNNRERASVGLYTYPVLQAADILLYKATGVPVGDDQRQHLELTRDVATKFNKDFAAADFFPLPESIICRSSSRIMSLRDGTMKMSKSDPSDQSRINLTDDADTVVAKIRRARTDAAPLPETLGELAERAEADNLVEIYASLANVSKLDVLRQFAGQGFSTFKPALSDVAVTVLEPISKRARRFIADPAETDRVMMRGADQAREIAEPILEEVMRLTGFWRRPAPARSA